MCCSGLLQLYYMQFYYNPYFSSHLEIMSFASYVICSMIHNKLKKVMENQPYNDNLL